MTERKHHRVTGMATTDPDRPQSLSNPPLTKEEKTRIKTAITNNIRDGGKAWMCYSNLELKALGLSYLKILRTR